MSVYLCEMCEETRDPDEHGLNDLFEIARLGDAPHPVCDECLESLYEKLGEVRDEIKLEAWLTHKWRSEE